MTFLLINSIALPGCGVGLHMTEEALLCHFPAAVLASINHPRPYLPNTRYSWTILTASSTYVQLTFQTIDLPSSHSTCDQDHINVYDGAGNTDEELGEFCSSRKPSGPVLASMNRMFLTFETHEESGGTGFMANYHAVNFQPKVSLRSPYDDGKDLLLWFLLQKKKGLFSIIIRPLYLWFAEIYLILYWQLPSW